MRNTTLECTQPILKEREKEIVNEELLLDQKCMNLVFGGEGGFISKTGYDFRKRKSEWKSKHSKTYGKGAF